MIGKRRTNRGSDHCSRCGSTSMGIDLNMNTLASFQHCERTRGHGGTYARPGPGEYREHGRTPSLAAVSTGIVNDNAASAPRYGASLRSSRLSARMGWTRSEIATHPPPRLVTLDDRHTFPAVLVPDDS